MSKAGNVYLGQRLEAKSRRQHLKHAAMPKPNCLPSVVVSTAMQINLSSEACTSCLCICASNSYHDHYTIHYLLDTSLSWAMHLTRNLIEVSPLDGHCYRILLTEKCSLWTADTIQDPKAPELLAAQEHCLCVPFYVGGPSSGLY